MAPSRPLTRRGKNPRNGKSKSNGNAVQRDILQVFPARLSTVLPYADRYTLSGTTLLTTFGSEQSFRLGSLFDPDFTGTGHQPFGYDQLTPFYVRYLVTHVDIVVTFSDPSTDGVYVGAFIKSYNDPATLVNCTIGQAMERPNVFCQALNNTGSQRITFKKSVNLAAISGMTDAEYAGAWATTGALVTTNPALSPYLSIAVADSNGAASSASCKVTVELKMRSIFCERVMPGQS